MRYGRRRRPADHFRQRDPDEGQPATERTEIRVLYDDDALYVGARMFDSSRPRISKRLTGTRTSGPTPTASRSTWTRATTTAPACSFTVSAAGVQGTAALQRQLQGRSWDAVWEFARSRTTSTGWSAELRIPFSQLRFKEAAQQTWGINVSRFIHRQERDGLARVLAEERQRHGVADDAPHGARRRPPAAAPESRPTPPRAQEFVARAGRRSVQRRLAHVRLARRRPQGPVKPAYSTLDATINPDFGQAEVDPAVVNLSAYETFYPEKRRFFIEGSEIFNNFGRGGSNNFFGFNTSDPLPLLLASHRTAAFGEPRGDFVDSPRATTILGAAKLTGKTGNNWSVGIVEAVTGPRARATGHGIGCAVARWSSR